MENVKVARRKKPLKVVLISILSLFVLVIAAIFVLWFISGRPSLHRVDAAQMRTMDFTNVEMHPPGFAADALYLVQLVENTHPIFVTEGWLPSNYETIRDEFLVYASDGNLTRQDFAFAMLRYFTALRDGHMNILAAITTTYLDVRWQVQNEHLYLLNDGGTISDIEVIEIGGVPVSQIFATIARYYYSENEFALEGSRNRFSRTYEIITRAGGNVGNGGVVQLTLNDNGSISAKNAVLTERSPDGADYYIEIVMIDDVFVLDIRTFINVPSHATELAVQSIESAVSSGTRKFIVDVRGNNGGSSWVAQRLLNAMGIRTPEVGSVERFSQRDGMWHFGILYSLGFDYSRMSPSVNPSRNRNDVFVSVLTDAGTFSTAMWMGMWVQDGGFGNVIGSPSRNAPTSFGNTRAHALPYSGLWFMLSYNKWLRPDADANQTVLMPDILVDPDYALDVAIEHFRNLD